jgi:epoxyqueuosine reductase
MVNRSQLVKSIASELGFTSCGISKAEFLEDEAPRLALWLKQGRHGEMSYMENHFDKRLDPTNLVSGAKSVVSLLYNYYSDQQQTDPEAPKISKYALGEDYHHVIKTKLRLFMDRLSSDVGEIAGRAFVDSAPVMDKVWAAKSGLGWIGKHTNLITKDQGSYFFIAELILDVELEPDGPIKDYCGTCTRCIDACPTDAIIEPYVVDGSKCISYFTIELKNEIIPKDVQGQFSNWAFGCDICQEVCPWNRFSLKHKEAAFEPSADLLNMTSSDWHDMTEEVFMRVFQHSPIKRTGYTGLKRNLKFLKLRPPTQEMKKL